MLGLRKKTSGQPIKFVSKSQEHELKYFNSIANKLFDFHEMKRITSSEWPDMI